MKMSVIILSVVVALLGVGSAVLGFIAEGTQLTRNDIKISGNECVYPANPAFTLGFVAALLLLVAQITGSAVGGCCGCCKPRGAGFSGSKPVSKRKRAIGAALCVLSWIAALIAERYFLVGAISNAPITHEASHGGGCYYVKQGVFMMAAILSIVATVLGIISYIILCAATSTPGGVPETKPDGIAIGQPAAAEQYTHAAV